MSLFDERVAITIICLWSGIVLLCLLAYNPWTIFGFGPSPELIIFNIPIDTWAKWAAVMTYIIVNQCIETYGLNTISPWLINDIQNKHVTTIGYSPLTVQLINIFWNLYLRLSWLIAMRLVFTQFDFILMITVMTCLTGIGTTAHYLKDKRFSLHHI